MKKWDFISLKKILFNFQVFIFICQIKISILEEVSQYVEIIKTQTFNSTGSLIDITDYHKIYPIITVTGQIYTELPSKLSAKMNAGVLEYTAGATYNNNLILLACTNYNLLSFINIKEKPPIENSLIEYEGFIDKENINSCSM